MYVCCFLLHYSNDTVDINTAEDFEPPFVSPQVVNKCYYMIYATYKYTSISYIIAYHIIHYTVTRLLCDFPRKIGQDFSWSLYITTLCPNITRYELDFVFYYIVIVDLVIS